MTTSGRCCPTSWRARGLRLLDFPDELVQECWRLRWQFGPGTHSVHDLGVVLDIVWLPQIEGAGELVEIDDVGNLGLRETQYGDGAAGGHSGTNGIIWIVACGNSA